jgi:hypothetical protein
MYQTAHKALKAKVGSIDEVCVCAKKHVYVDMHTHLQGQGTCIHTSRVKAHIAGLQYKFIHTYIYVGVCLSKHAFIHTCRAKRTSQVNDASHTHTSVTSIYAYQAMLKCMHAHLQGQAHVIGQRCEQYTHASVTSIYVYQSM